MLKPLLIILPLTFVPPVQADCALATDLLYRANEMHLQGAPVADEMAVLTQALENCPDNPHAHNNLANLLGDQKQYAQAVAHYRQALALDPKLTAAWYGMGETYRAWGQLPPALEAYLHACAQDKDAKIQVEKLLKDQVFAEVPSGQVLDQDAILLMLDSNRLQEMVTLINACGLGYAGRVAMKSTLILRNLEFETGQANLADTEINQQQIQAISGALKQLPPDRSIKVDGHSDNKRFAGLSRAESDRRNFELSQQRAETIRATLRAKGVTAARIVAQGYGHTQPISRKDQDRNRRVEITVE